MITLPIKPPTLNDEIERFLDQWHRFFVDAWWRNRYNIPFGSAAHREQSFIDMAIEYQEQQRVKRYQDAVKQREEDDLRVLDPDDDRTVKMTKEEADDIYANLDLTQFDNG